MPKNPLLAYPLDWRQLTVEKLPRLLDEGLKTAKARLKKLEALPLEKVTYENFLAPMDDLAVELERAFHIAYHLNSVGNTPQTRALIKKYSPIVTEFFAKITVNEKLWLRLKKVSGKKLKPIEQRHLMLAIRAFKRAGAELNAAGKKEYVKLVTQLELLSNDFNNKVLDATNAFEKYFPEGAEKKELKGLPPTALEMGRADAKAKGKKGYRFTLQAPSYTAIAVYADDRDLRKEFTLAYQEIGRSKKFDTHPVIKKMLELRHRLARLLGYKNFASYQLYTRMLNTPAKVSSLLLGLLKAARPHTLKSFELRARFKRELGDKTPFEPWDAAYYGEKLEQKVLGLNTEKLRPYFEFTRVRQNLFELAQTLYGITFKKRAGHKAWHPDVEYFEIFDNRTHEQLGGFYTDFFARANKHAGAWHDAMIKTSHSLKGSQNVAVIVGNFTPPTSERPALLTHDEVTTLFHEFGHLMHSQLTEIKIPSMAGTDVAYDFVELPSMFMENYCFDEKFLKKMARHYETQETLPQQMLEGLLKSKTFMFSTRVRHISVSALFDLRIHELSKVPADVEAYVEKVVKPYALPFHTKPRTRLRQFGHLFGGGISSYATGYYCYQWSEVMQADVWEYFEKHGTLSPKVGGRFRRTILSKGDSKPAIELYKDMMGRAPKMDAYLRRLKS